MIKIIFSLWERENTEEDLSNLNYIDPYDFSDLLSHPNHLISAGEQEKAVKMDEDQKYLDPPTRDPPTLFRW